jgi:hypothetical protein
MGEGNEDQIRILRRMTPAQKLRAIKRLYWTARAQGRVAAHPASGLERGANPARGPRDLPECKNLS